jgi:hypothetical protein
MKHKNAIIIYFSELKDKRIHSPADLREILEKNGIDANHFFKVFIGDDAAWIYQSEYITDIMSVHNVLAGI